MGMGAVATGSEDISLGGICALSAMFLGGIATGTVLAGGLVFESVRTAHRELTEQRRYAPTSIPLRRNPGSRSPESLFHFTETPTPHSPERVARRAEIRRTKLLADRIAGPLTINTSHYVWANTHAETTEGPQRGRVLVIQAVGKGQCDRKPTRRHD